MERPKFKKYSMKIFIILFFNCCVSFACTAQRSIYGFTITDVNGQQHQLQNDSAKVIWIVILPVTETSTDSAFLVRIDSVNQAHIGNMTTIVVPSYDDGYTDNTDNMLMNGYQKILDSTIIISKPLLTHKTAGPLQDPLFQWLTNASLNNHFDEDVTGPSSSFFVDAEGKLYGELSPSAKFSNKALNKILN
jgi:hypothetical protein